LVQITRIAAAALAYFEDIQWIDHSSGQLLGQVVVWAANASALILMTHRSELPEQTNPSKHNELTTRAVSIGIESGFPRGAKRRSLGGRFSFWDALRRRIGQFVRRLSTEVAPNSSLMQDILQHDRNPL
jgi:hypothetical protein